MKKYIYSTVLTAFLIFAIGNNVLAADCNSIKDAKGYWKFGMPNDAIACLGSIISQNPTNKKAHFLKGMYCLESGRYACAYDRFSVKPVIESYRRDIVSAYLSKASTLLPTDKNIALLLYRKVVKLDPAQAKAISKKLLDSGHKNDAISFNGELRQKIVNRYYALYQSEGEEAGLPYLEKADYYSKGKYKNEISRVESKLGKRYAEKWKELFTLPGKEHEAKTARKKAISYLGAKYVNTEFPETITYHSGDKPIFKVAKGHYSPHWIRSTTKVKGGIQIQSMPGSEYELHFKNGHIVRMWKGEKPPRIIRKPFRFFAKEDSTIRVVYSDSAATIKTASTH